MQLLALIHQVGEENAAAGFVGANNRMQGTVRAIHDGVATVEGRSGMQMHALVVGNVGVGDAAECFVRPEVTTLALQADEFTRAGLPHFIGQVDSILFDGANSAVLLKDAASALEIRVALPQTGKFADLRPGDRVHYGFDPRRAICFGVDRAPQASR